MSARMDDKTSETLHAQLRRLDYAVLQLTREAKFLPEAKPENRRFHRAYACVTEVRDELQGLLYRQPPVPKTREEMAAFARDWDAKVDASRAKEASK